MPINKLKAMRQSAPLTQAAFAAEMGIPLRTYEDLENGRSQVRQIHINAAAWALLKIATEYPLAAMHVPAEIIDVARQAIENYDYINPADPE